jgi:hypothetical protein
MSIDNVRYGQPSETNPTVGAFFDMTGRTSGDAAGKNGARVYSYLHCFDGRQAAGHSADRQLQYAQRGAVDHGWCTMSC